MIDSGFVIAIAIVIDGSGLKQRLLVGKDVVEESDWIEVGAVQFVALGEEVNGGHVGHGVFRCGGTARWDGVGLDSVSERLVIVRALNNIDEI